MIDPTRVRLVGPSYLCNVEDGSHIVIAFFLIIILLVFLQDLLVYRISI